MVRPNFRLYGGWTVWKIARILFPKRMRPFEEKNAAVFSKHGKSAGLSTHGFRLVAHVHYFLA